MSPGAVVKWGSEELESSFPEWLRPTAVDLPSTVPFSSHYAFLQSKPSKGPRWKRQYFMTCLRDSHHHLRCVFLVPLVLSESVQEGSHQLWAPEWWAPGAIFKGSHHGQYCYPNSRVRQKDYRGWDSRAGGRAGRLQTEGSAVWLPGSCSPPPTLKVVHGVFWCIY